MNYVAVGEALGMSSTAQVSCVLAVWVTELCVNTKGRKHQAGRFLVETLLCCLGV